MCSFFRSFFFHTKTNEIQFDIMFGLDAYSAQQLASILVRLTKQGTTIMCTIHQPSSQIFSMFHKLLLLADGRVSFLGTPDEAISFFSS